MSGYRKRLSEERKRKKGEVDVVVSDEKDQTQISRKRVPHVFCLTLFQ